MRHLTKAFAHSLLTFLSLTIIAILCVGCGTSATNTVTNPQTQTAPAFVIGTDAPLPSVTSFSVQLMSIDAITADGTSVPLLSGTPTVDFARFNGLQTLIDMNDVPVGTYTGITVTLGPATLGYLNVVAGVAPTIQTEDATLSTTTITKTLATPLVVAATEPAGLHFDFDLRKSIQVDSTGQITGNVTPTFNLNVVRPSDSGPTSTSSTPPSSASTPPTNPSLSRVRTAVNSPSTSTVKPSGTTTRASALSPPAASSSSPASSTAPTPPSTPTTSASSPRTASTRPAS
jgi:Domain of unknown function (DUF4382)